MTQQEVQGESKVQSKLKLEPEDKNAKDDAGGESTTTGGQLLGGSYCSNESA